MFEIMVCSLKRAYQLSKESDMSQVAILVVSSYTMNQDKLNGFTRKLCLNFADTNNPKNEDVFSNDMAFQITKYVHNLPDDLDTLIICCDSGESTLSPQWIGV